MRKLLVLLALAVMLLGCRERECSTSLVDRFSQARFVPETWLLDFGVQRTPPWTSIKVPAHREPLISGWSADEQWGDDEKTTFVWATGRSSVLHLHRFASQELELRFRCRPHVIAGRDAQTITAFFNGSEVGTITLKSEFTSYGVSIPASLVRRGQNVVEFRYAYSARPSGSANDSRDLAVAWDWIEITERRTRPNKRMPRKDAAAVAVPFRSAVRYALEVVPKSALVIDAVVAEGETDAADRGTVRITLFSRGAPLKTFDVSPAGDTVRIDIPVAVPSAVELEVAALPPPGRRSGTYALLRAPRIVHPCE